MPVKQNSSVKPLKKSKVLNLESKNETRKEIKKVSNPDELIFALDIGTRTVIGVVGVQEKDKFKIISTEILEHKSRSMLDGQIHDVNQVAQVAKEVKEKLEKKTGVALSKVSIAAAGRVLKTSQAKVERDIDQAAEIDRELVSNIELEAIQQAQLTLDGEASNEEKIQFYCVGYSVINYYLNGYVISSLSGHKGKKIGVEVLATFLPHVVVDSLYTVMNKIGLEVISLTLEPIAAINVTIPRDLRLLNLALVDVGAGTSDIALTKDGTVIAYAMAPVAGDEITEKIIQYYLVDFNTAEKIKISLSQDNDNIDFTDIVGVKHSVKRTEVLEVIKQAVEHLAETITDKILEYNHKAPNAVFLIGGGSQVPDLSHMIARRLELPEERVAVRGRDVIRNIKISGKKLSGPESITPIGIAVTAQTQQGQDFLTVTFNGRKIRLFNSKKLTVADSLILIGFNPGQLIGRTGKSINFQLNGVRKVIRGEFGKPAEIFVNEAPANLETILKSGDNIRVNPAENGKDAEIKVSDVIMGNNAIRVTLNGSQVTMRTRICINGKDAFGDTRIQDGDSVEVHEISTVRDLLKLSEISDNEFDIFLNGKQVDLEYKISNNDLVECRKKTFVIKEEVTEDEYHGNELRIILNGNPTVIKGEKTQYIFVDIFSYVNFDLTKPQGTIVLKLNGQQAGFTDTIKSGDSIDIYWQK